MALEIQQSINQLLGSTAVAAGLYAHSPGAKRRQEIKDLKRNITEGEARAEAAEKGYQKAGLSPEEAQVKAHDIREKTIAEKKRLAELTGGNPKQFEDIAWDEQMVEVQKEELQEKKIKEAQGKAEAAKAESDVSNIINEAERAIRLEKRESKIAEIQKQQQLAEEQKAAQVAAAQRNKAESDFIRDVIMNPGKYPPNAIQDYKANQSVRKVI